MSLKPQLQSQNLTEKKQNNKSAILQDKFTFLKNQTLVVKHHFFSVAVLQESK